MRPATRTLALWAFPVGLVLFALWIYPGQRGEILLVSTTIAVGVTALVLLYRVARPTRSFSAVAKLLQPRKAAPVRPTDLARLERVLGWKVYSGPEFDHRIKPVIRPILRARLLEKENIDIDRDPVRALATVSPSLAPLVEVGEGGPRVETADLETMVRDLEAI